jgi:hypothetical protein
MSNYGFNPNNLDFERGMVYTRKQHEEINQPISQTQNVKKPLPIQFKTDGQKQTDFTFNPITGQSSNNNSIFIDPVNSYQNKKECRNDLQNRLSGYQNLPHTQRFPVFNQNPLLNNNNNFFFDNKPVNTRMGENQGYTHF